MIAHPHYQLHHQPSIAYRMDRWPTDLTETFLFLGRSHTISFILIPFALYCFILYYMTALVSHMTYPVAGWHLRHYSVLHFTLELHDAWNLWFFVWHNQILWQSITFSLIEDYLFIVWSLSLWNSWADHYKWCREVKQDWNKAQNHCNKGVWCPREKYSETTVTWLSCIWLCLTKNHEFRASCDSRVKCNTL